MVETLKDGCENAALSCDTVQRSRASRLDLWHERRKGRLTMLSASFRSEARMKCETDRGAKRDRDVPPKKRGVVWCNVVPKLELESAMK